MKKNNSIVFNYGNKLLGCIMKRYRISKYSEYVFKNTDWLNNEWTGYADIGKFFHGKKLIKEEYLVTESNYIKVILDILEYLDISELKLNNCELDNKKDKASENSVVSLEEFHKKFKRMLRSDGIEEWCIFVGANKFRLRLGYDYVMYISCNLGLNTLNKICYKYKLYCAYYWDK